MFEDQQNDMPLYPPQALRCPNHNIARVLCISPNCHIQAFICFNNQCTHCMNTHQRCKGIKFPLFMEKMMKKKQNISLQIQRAVQSLEKIYDDACQMISIEKQKLRDNMTYYGFNPYQLEFLRKLNEGKANQILGKHGHMLYQKIGVHDKFQATSLSIKQYWQDNQYNLKRILEGLRNITKIKAFGIQSQVTDNIEAIQDFFGMKKKIYKLDLLYRASENNFSTDVFHQRCDGKSNTLILARTQFGKIVGAYTNMKWSDKKGYQKDKNSSSFIFSISNEEKYQASKPSLCKFNSKDGPGFGLDKQPLEFFICNDAKYKAESFFDFGKCFVHKSKDDQREMPKFGTKQNFLYLSGNDKGTKFVRLAQWQVFTVQFG